MNVSMRLASPRVTVAPADDPYKKGWWAILAGFAVTGAWLCLPIMETSVGSTRVDTSRPAVDPNAAQSLDAVDNPSGAPGSALNLSMDAAKGKGGGGGDVASMLYQAPPEAGAAAGAPVGAAVAAGSTAHASLAQQLKDAAQARDAGGWNEKARGGFSAPRLSGGGLSGVGSARGGAGSSASVSAFGSNTAQVGFGATTGLRDDGTADKAGGGGGGLQALRNAANTAQSAAITRSGDNARSSLARVFDGAKTQNAIGAADGGLAGAGAYAALDAAPANLKINNPKLDAKELKEPPAKDEPPPPPEDNMGQQLAMMAATALIGGLIPGQGGQMVMMMGMQMMQQRQAQQAEERTQHRADQARQKAGLPTQGL